MKNILTILVFTLVMFAVGCASQNHDVEFGYLAKAQEKRMPINDVFFNTTHSAYQKYRVYPDEPVPDDEIAVFSEKTLPPNHHPVDNETMRALLKELDNHRFFEIGRSVDTFKQAIQIFNAERYIKQCFVLIVDGKVTIAIPPKSLGPNADDDRVNEFMKIMEEFKIYGWIYTQFTQLFRRSQVDTKGGMSTFVDDVERARDLSDEERRDIDEHRSERDRLHGE